MLSEQTATHHEPEAAQLDLHVGILRAQWSPNLPAVVAVSSTAVVTYDAAQHQFTLIELKSQRQQLLAFVTIASKVFVSPRVPLFSSVHVIEHQGETLLFCIATDRVQFCIFSVFPKAPSDAQSTTARVHPITLPPTPLVPRHFTLLIAGTLPWAATHFVPFLYRAAHYALCYQSASGNGCVLAIATLCNVAAARGDDCVSDAAIISRPRLTPGWSHIVWKGTHHIRCTRQKFFCYDTVTGRSVFECIWIRHSSATTSVCSREIMQLPTAQADRASDESNLVVNGLLRRKGCVVVPVTLGGHTACLLYTHSSHALPAENPDSVPVVAQSTSAVAKAAVGPETNVAAGAALLLKKKIFAHAERWSHFCTLSMACDDLLLCYSARSGVVWVSRIARSANPANEVTLYKRRSDTDPSLQLTTATLHRVEVNPLDISDFAAETVRNLNTPSTSQNRESPVASSRSYADSVGIGTRRPGSSSRRVLHSIANGMERELASISYAESIRNIVQHMTGSLFDESSPVAEAAKAIVDDPSFDEPAVRRLISIADNLSKRRQQPTRPATAQSQTWRSVSSERNATMQHVPEWQSVTGIKGIAPPPRHSDTRRFEHQRAAYRASVLPKKQLSPSSLERLLRSRDVVAFQRDAIQKQLNEFKKGDPTATTGRSDVSPMREVVRRLYDMPMQKREATRTASQSAPSPLVARRVWPDEADMIEHTLRLGPPAAVERHRAAVENIRRKLEASSGATYSPLLTCHRTKTPRAAQFDPIFAPGAAPPPPLTPEQQENLKARLITQSQQRRATELAAARAEMNRAHQPPHIVLRPEAIADTVKRLSSPPVHQKPDSVFTRHHH